MSFLLDPALLILTGLIVNYICVRFLFKGKHTHWVRPCLLIIVQIVFWLISGALYFDLLDMPGLGAAGKGNHFMWNSGIELFGLPPMVDTTPPTYTNPVGFWNILAFLLFATYPFFLWVGLNFGYILFGRTERQRGVVGLFFR